MARGVNKVILVGNVGADPEVRDLPNGGSVTNISLATSEQWTDKNTNEKQERVTWHRITLFNRLGEIAGEYVRKGSQIYIEGSIRTDKYEKDGETRYSTSIIANNMQLLGGKGNDSGGDSVASPPAGQASAPATGGEFYDMDVPF